MENTLIFLRGQMLYPDFPLPVSTSEVKKDTTEEALSTFYLAQ